MTRRPLLGISIAILVAGTALGVIVADTAAAGTCTVLPGGFSIFATVPSAGGDFPFTASNADVTFGMDVDEASGKVTLRRDGVPQVNVGTQGGPVIVTVAGPPVTGTIDATGSMWIPNFNVDTLFAGTIDLPTNPTLATGPQAVNLKGTDYTRQGVPLDFTTGVVTLSGADVIPSAPIVEEPVISGIRLTCRLDPIPDQAKLPHPPTLKGVRGTSTSTGDDTLVLRGSVAAKKPTIDVKRQDVFVRFDTTDGHEILTVTSTVQETQEPGAKKPTLVRSLTLSKPRTDPAPAPEGSKLTVRGNKRRAKVTLRIPGLDLTALSGSVSTTIAIGPNVATIAAVAQGGKITTR